MCLDTVTFQGKRAKSPKNCKKVVRYKLFKPSYISIVEYRDLYRGTHREKGILYKSTSHELYNGDFFYKAGFHVFTTKYQVIKYRNRWYKEEWGYGDVLIKKVECRNKVAAGKQDGCNVEVYTWMKIL